jgi:lipoyl(octanoyl) transferase
MHGFALNVNTDMQYYEGIIPCGILEYGVTSMEKLLSHEVNMKDVKNTLISSFKNVFMNNIHPMN